MVDKYRELLVSDLVKEFTTFHGNRTFSAMLQGPVTCPSSELHESLPRPFVSSFNIE
jgi:hypothetical protein